MLFSCLVPDEWGAFLQIVQKYEKKFETKKIKIKFFHFIEHKHNQKKATKMTLKIQICEKKQSSISNENILIYKF